ncbi:hypothetical protein ACUWR8_005783, partial [Escherichia coli]
MKDQITYLPDNADRSVAKQKFTYRKLKNQTIPL